MYIAWNKCNIDSPKNVLVLHFFVVSAIDAKYLLKVLTKL